MDMGTTAVLMGPFKDLKAKIDWHKTAYPAKALPPRKKARASAGAAAWSDDEDDKRAKEVT